MPALSSQLAIYVYIECTIDYKATSLQPSKKMNEMHFECIKTQVHVIDTHFTLCYFGFYERQLHIIYTCKTGVPKFSGSVSGRWSKVCKERKKHFFL